MFARLFIGDSNPFPRNIAIGQTIRVQIQLVNEWFHWITDSDALLQFKSTSLNCYLINESLERQDAFLSWSSPTPETDTWSDETEKEEEENQHPVKTLDIRIHEVPNRNQSRCFCLVIEPIISGSLHFLSVASRPFFLATESSELELTDFQAALDSLAQPDRLSMLYFPSISNFPCSPSVSVQHPMVALQLRGDDDHGVLDIGCRVWDGALRVLTYLNRNPELIRNQRVLELGAGTGFLGVACKKLGASQVIVTDLIEMVPLISTTVKVNSNSMESDVLAKELNWGVTDVALFQPPLDVVIASDVAYLIETIKPLLFTLFHLTNHQSRILISCKRRSGLLEFLELAEVLFQVEVVDDLNPNVLIYTFQKKMGSEWNDIQLAIEAKEKNKAVFEDLDDLDGIGGFF